MTNLCFGTYARILQDAMQEPNNNQAITEVLLGLITDHEQVVDKNGSPINIIPKMVSNLFNFKQDVPKAIVSGSTLPTVTQEAYTYFDKNIVLFLNPHKRDDLLHNMVQLISQDVTIPKDKKEALLANATSDMICEFLADTFLYAINKPNKESTNKSKAKTSADLTQVLKEIEILETQLSSFPRPKMVEIPAEVKTHEMVYVTELLASYADAEGLDELPKETLSQYPKYKKDFERRRKDYYAAETIQRGSRDVFSDTDLDQFEVLKDETYNGVIDVYSCDYSHGFERLNKVMAQAAIISVDKCLLSRLPNWIGASEKKGVCHILVNDGNIKGWVESDE